MSLQIDFGAILGAVTDVIFVVDVDARIRYINHVLPGFDEATVVGSSSLSYVHRDHQADYLLRLERVFATGEVDAYEIRSEAPHRDGFNWYFVRMRCLPGSDPRLAVVSSTDITERKRLEAHREALLGELQDTMATLRSVQAIVPQCGHCQAVRVDDEVWEPLEMLSQRSGTGPEVVCPTCRPQVLAEA